MKKGLKKLLAVALSGLVLAGCFGGNAYAEETGNRTGTFNVLSLNVAGLPGIISSSDPAANTIKMSPLLNNYDIVSVQEDFAYDNQLRTYLTFPYQTAHSGNVPFGDGMNIFSRFPIYQSTRYKWNDAYGFITNGADQMTPKGILYTTIEIEEGFFVDVYDIHTDADCDEGSLAARRSNMEQLAELILARSAGRAVIVIGDTNSRYTREGDNFETAVLEPCGLTDAWIELVRHGDVPNDGEALMDHDNPNSPANEVVDKIWYRSGKNVELQADSYALLVTEFADENGVQLSDHYPITAGFSYTINPTVKNSDSYGGGGGNPFSFIEAMDESAPDSVTIATGSRVDSVSMTYAGTVVSAGGSGGTAQTLYLSEGEYITSVTVSKAKKSTFGTYRISYIRIETNFGNVLEGGKKNSSLTTTFTAPQGYQVAGFYGHSADEIDRLGCIYLLNEQND